MDEVGDARPARVLDDHAIARPQLGLQHPLDPVERAADDRDVAGDAVGGEVGPRQLDQPLQLDRTAVELVLGIEPGQRRRERRQQGRVGVAAGEVARARGERSRASHPQRGLGRDDRAAAAVGADQAALAERAVGGGDRGRADFELGGQLSDGGQPSGRREAPVGDRRLDPVAIVAAPASGAGYYVLDETSYVLVETPRRAWRRSSDRGSGRAWRS